MNTEFLYIESQILCIIFTAVVLKLNWSYLQGTFIFIAVIGFLSILASIADIIGVVFHHNTFCVQAFEIIYLSCLGAIGYFWFMFCIQQFGVHNRILKYISLLPALSATGLATLCAQNYGMFVCGRVEYVGIINYIYLVGAYIAAFVVSKQSKSQKVGREYALMASVSTPTILSGVQSLIIPEGLPTQTYAILLALLILCFRYQRKKMVTDNLTELPNRYGMDEEIEEQLRQYKKDKNDSFYVIVCDMDNFKTINDTWGHLEGDRALKLIAEVLERVAQQYNSEVFRIGGDEFVVITDTSESGLAEEICKALQQGLDAIDFRHDFEICMSMGVSLYDGRCTIAEMIQSADRKLYQAKQKNKENTRVV